MRTDTIESFSHVAVMAENLKSAILREVMSTQPFIEMTSYSLAMLFPIIIHVINSKELRMRLSTARALSTISCQRLFTKFLPQKLVISFFLFSCFTSMPKRVAHFTKMTIRGRANLTNSTCFWLSSSCLKFSLSLCSTSPNLFLFFRRFREENFTIPLCLLPIKFWIVSYIFQIDSMTASFTANIKPILTTFTSTKVVSSSRKVLLTSATLLFPRRYIIDLKNYIINRLKVQYFKVECTLDKIMGYTMHMVRNTFLSITAPAIASSAGPTTCLPQVYHQISSIPRKSPNGTNVQLSAIKLCEAA